MAANLHLVGEHEIERDRKTCVALDLNITGANRELAQWLIEHPKYSNRVVGGWLGCACSRVCMLRKWARKGFPGTPFDKKNHPSVLAREQSALKSQDNFEAAEIADPAVVEDNVIYTLQRINEHARIFRKLFKASAFDQEAKGRIITAIDRTIRKWKLTRSTLARKESSNGKAKAESDVQTRRSVFRQS